MTTDSQRRNDTNVGATPAARPWQGPPRLLPRAGASPLPRPTSQARPSHASHPAVVTEVDVTPLPPGPLRSDCPGPPPRQRRSEAWLQQPRELTGPRRVTGCALVEDQIVINRDSEDAPGTTPQLEADQNRRPPLQDLGRHPDGVVHVVSRHAPFDDNAVSWIDHLSLYNRTGPAPASLGSLPPGSGRPVESGSVKV
jgi:hypothetical protein